MNVIIGFAFTFAVLTLSGYLLQWVYRRKSYQGPVKALFHVATTLVALGMFASVITYLAISLVSYK